jgi:ATP-dependent Lon protease
MTCLMKSGVLMFSLKQVKEKTIAARRSGVKTIIFPSANRRDFDELASNVKEGLKVHFVDKYGEIYDIAFTSDAET